MNTSQSTACELVMADETLPSDLMKVGMLSTLLGIGSYQAFSLWEEFLSLQPAPDVIPVPVEAPAPKVAPAPVKAPAPQPMAVETLIINEVKKFVDLANSIWPDKTIIFKDIDISFKLRGKAAGMATIWPNNAKFGLKFNLELAEANLDDFIFQTVPHEVAHLYQHKVYGWGKTRPHGYRWQLIMRKFGRNPTRTHNYDTSNLSTNKGKIKYMYVCKCKNFEHPVSQLIHKRMLNGQERICTTCRGRITYTGRTKMI